MHICPALSNLTASSTESVTTCILQAGLWISFLRRTALSTPVPPHPTGVTCGFTGWQHIQPQQGASHRVPFQIQHFYLTRQGQTLPGDSHGLILPTSPKKNKLCCPQGKRLLPFPEGCSRHYSLEQGTGVSELVLAPSENLPKSGQTINIY